MGHGVVPWSLWLVLALAWGCSADLPERRFLCSVRGECPTGWYCVERHCQSTPGRDAAVDAAMDARVDAPPPRDAGPDVGSMDARPERDAPVDAGRRSCATPGDCNDMNPCTIDICGSDLFCNYAWKDDGTACDDSVVCNGEDTCMSAVCMHEFPPCTDCTDGNPCTGRDRMTDGGCAGDPGVMEHQLCGACDSTTCRMCCTGVCRDVSSYDYCAGCYSACSGAESCMYSAGRACGWLWCCGT